MLFLVPLVLLTIILGRYALFPEKIDICSFLETRFGLECQDPFKIKGSKTKKSSFLFTLF